MAHILLYLSVLSCSIIFPAVKKRSCLVTLRDILRLKVQLLTCCHASSNYVTIVYYLLLHVTPLLVIQFFFSKKLKRWM